MSLAIDAIHRLCTAQATVETALGPLTLARTRLGLAGAWFEGQRHHPGPIEAPIAAQDPLLARAADQLHSYFSGRPTSFDIPLDLQGTPFQQRVWQALLQIAAGSTSSYARIAAACDAAQAVRAVGAAIGRNPVSIIVPCHRVIGSNGALTGYAGGIARKQALLDLEAHQAETRAAA
jgi:methylated-DNA-[protein]-cysteine S-methyltransferase